MPRIVRLMSPHGVELWTTPLEDHKVANDAEEVPEGELSSALRRASVEDGVSKADATAGKLVISTL